jgi:hypothetical protein
MLYVIYTKEVKRIKDEYNITYYLETHRREIKVIYEFTGLYRYDFRRYHITLNYDIIHEGIIVSNVIKNLEKVCDNIKQNRKLAVISKFIVYNISKELNIPVYKLLKEVSYEANGEIIRLSPHAFINSIYKLSSIFEKILS